MEQTSRGRGWNWRQGLVLVVMVGCTLPVGRNLVDLQIVQHAQLLQAARNQWIESRTLQPVRGMIYDRDGNVLVSTDTQTKVAMFPQQVSEEDPVHRKAMDEIAAILGLKDPYSLWAQVQRDQKEGLHYDRLVPQEVSADVANRLEDLHIPWLDLVPRNVPAYPDGSLAAQVLGFMSPDPNNPDQGVGQYGVEQYYNTLLRGNAQVVPVGSTMAPPTGASLYLTISGEIQQDVENVLQSTVKSSKAAGGAAIVMDPHTGAILAMASYPTYDPNAYNQVSSYSLYQNSAVSMEYEPGSTFKILTISAGIDSGKITPRTMVYDNGAVYCSGYQITNWTNGTGWGWETPTRMLRYSANVGAAEFAEKIGAPTFYRYLTAFGLGTPTGVDLAGEAPGYVRYPDDVHAWSTCDLLTNAFGQGIQVTPLQLITAVAAVANGGWLMRPYIVGRIMEQQNHSTKVITIKPHRVRQVISAQTASTMTNILEESAKDGEASLALVNGYGVAAKTGTAQVAGAGCGYNCNLGTIASLIGFAPAHNPRFIALIVIRHPQTSPWGSVVAAPAFASIAQRLFLVMGIPPNTPASR